MFKLCNWVKVSGLGLRVCWLCQSGLSFSGGSFSFGSGSPDQKSESQKDLSEEGNSVVLADDITRPEDSSPEARTSKTSREGSHVQLLGNEDPGFPLQYVFLSVIP